jgi:hypothetical protein
MTADELRKMEYWQKAFSETMLKESAVQLVEIHELLVQLVEMAKAEKAEQKAKTPPPADDKPHAKPKRR